MTNKFPKIKEVQNANLQEVLTWTGSGGEVKDKLTSEEILKYFLFFKDWQTFLLEYILSYAHQLLDDKNNHIFLTEVLSISSEFILVEGIVDEGEDKGKHKLFRVSTKDFINFKKN